MKTALRGPFAMKDLRSALRRLALALGVGAVLALLVRLLSGKRLTYTPAADDEAPAPRAKKSSRDVLGRKRFEHAAFISHAKADASLEARYLQGELAKCLREKCFLDSDDLRDLTKLQQHVAESRCVVLVQSTSVLQRPYCLLELITAIEEGVPIVGVTLVSGSASHAYEFAAAARFLSQLDRGVLDDANPGAGDLLREHGVDLTDAAFKLSNTLPKIISIKLELGASKNVLSATLDDVAAAIKEATLPRLPDKGEWLRVREADELRTAPAEHGKVGQGGSPAAARAGGRGPPSPTRPGRRLGARLPRTVPALPDGYCPRPNIFDELKAQVLQAAAKGEAAAGKVVARGMGGLGKTTLAAALVRDPSVLEAFEGVAWLSIGQKPEVAQLQHALLRQFGGAAPADADEARLYEELTASCAGRKLLLVLDDPWQQTHEAALNALGDGTGSVCLVTTRIRGLVKGAAEVELALLSEEEALAMLLQAGDVKLAKGAAVPAAAREAIELCGRLPLCLSVAGAMIAEHADDWQTWLGPALKEGHGAELRERSVDGESASASVEERVLTASLRSINAEDRRGVAALFDFCAIFAEDATVPAAVFDALAHEIVAAADDETRRRSLDADQTPPAKAAPPPKLSKRASSRHAASSLVRRWLREAIRHSLVMGSIADGLRMHDLVRDFTLARAADREGGVAALQRDALRAMLKAGLETGREKGGGGFVDLVVAMDAGERGADLPAYVSLSLRHHLAGALDETTPLSDPETGALDEFVHTMIAEDEAAESLQLQQQLAQAVGVERLAAAAADAKDPVTAGRLYRAAGQGIKGGPKLRELLDKAVAEFKKSEGEGMASDLEARSWSQLMSAVGTGYSFGSDEHKLLVARLQELAGNGVTAAQDMANMQKMGMHWFGHMGVMLMLPNLPPDTHRFVGAERGSELAAEHLARVAEEHTGFQKMALPMMVSMRNAKTKAMKEAWMARQSLDFADSYFAMYAASEVLSTARLHSAPGADWAADFGDGGADVMRHFAPYDFAADHPNLKNLMGMRGQDVCGCANMGAVVALRWGNLGAARADFEVSKRMWVAVDRAVAQGHTSWDVYGAEERLTRLSRAVALSMVDVPAWAAAARGTFAHTLEGHVGAESLEVAVAQRQWKAIVTAKKMGHAVGSWTLAVDDAPGRSAGEYCFMGYDMMLFVARGTCALLDAADAGGASLLGGLPMQRGDSTLSSSGGGGGDGRALDDLDAWMPAPDALLHAAKHEVGWDVMLLGVQHPAVLGAALCERAGRWEAAAALARGSLEVLHQALARIEAGRVLARAHAAVGDRAAAVAALDDATAEAAAAKYVLLETLVARDRLRLLLDGGAALKRERDAARDVLREAAGRMAATDDELREVLGEDVWPKNE